MLIQRDEAPHSDSSALEKAINGIGARGGVSYAVDLY
jgi:hypothetical protein